jgi:hypothetical protein
LLSTIDTVAVETLLSRATSRSVMADFFVFLRLTNFLRFMPTRNFRLRRAVFFIISSGVEPAERVFR